MGFKSPRVQNTGTVWIQVESTLGTAAFPVIAGSAVSWSAPNGSVAKASQFFVVVENNNDGVVAIHSKVV